jgi:hypothetical protein
MEAQGGEGFPPDLDQRPRLHLAEGTTMQKFVYTVGVIQRFLERFLLLSPTDGVTSNLASELAMYIKSYSLARDSQTNLTALRANMVALVTLMVWMLPTRDELTAEEKGRMADDLWDGLVTLGNRRFTSTYTENQSVTFWDCCPNKGFWKRVFSNHNLEVKAITKKKFGPKAPSSVGAKAEPKTLKRKAASDQVQVERVRTLEESLSERAENAFKTGKGIVIPDDEDYSYQPGHFENQKIGIY